MGWSKRWQRRYWFGTIGLVLSLTISLGSLLNLPGGMRTAAVVLPSHRFPQAMVASAHPLASQAGTEILKQGGNAVDAAVATTFAISVVEPFSAGIGGGGFLLLYRAETETVEALDFRERAPLAATQDMYLDAVGKPQPRASRDGHRAVAVPGTVAGLAAVHQKYGQLPWSQVVAPAIRLAEQGFVVGQEFARSHRLREAMLLSNPAARAVFTRHGQPYTPGDRLKQPDLARTLRAVAKDPQNFYQGEIAQAIAQDMKANGGLISLEDLARYQPTWRAPLCGDFQALQVCSMPPPSSGGVHLLQLLNLVAEEPLQERGWRHPDSLHWLVESMRLAYADRAIYLGDPAFTEVPVAALTSRTYAEQQKQTIDRDRARPSSDVKPIGREALERLQLEESADTSHLTVVDEQRNAVSLTFTVNLRFGAGVVVPGTGIVLNNEMDDFAIAPDVPNAFGLVGDDANAIAPGKIPLSSMTPTLVMKDNRLRLAVGSPGGSRIITTVFQILLNHLVYGMDLGAAVSAPRLHHQWLPDTLFVERWGFDTKTLEDLRRRGHRIQPSNPWSNANAIAVDTDNSLEGAADPRAEGAVVGF